jgi:hypothetical protein
MPPVNRLEQARRTSAPGTYGFVVVVLVVFVVLVLSTGFVVVVVVVIDVESIGMVVVWLLMSPPLVVVVVVVLLADVVSGARSLFPQAATAPMTMSALSILIDRLRISSSLSLVPGAPSRTAGVGTSEAAKTALGGAKDAPTSASSA